MGVMTDLHQDPLVEGGWWACHYPERPNEPDITQFDGNCRRCMVALEVAVRTGPGTLHRTTDGYSRSVTVDEVHARIVQLT